MSLFRSSAEKAELNVTFEPRADMTALELAAILKQMCRMEKVLISQRSWDELPAPIKRHFREV